MSNFVPYRTSYSKHLYSLLRSGFYTRPLDADDFWFIDRIRHCGHVGGGTLGDLMPDRRKFGIYGHEGEAREAYDLWEDNSADPTYYDLDDEAALDEMAWYQQNKALQLASLEHRKLVQAEHAEASAARRLMRAENAAKRRAEFERRWLQRQADDKLQREILAQEYRAWEHAQELIAREREERLRKTAIADLEWEAAEKKRIVGVSSRQRRELAEAERALKRATSAMYKLGKKVKHHEHREEHRGYPREDVAGLEADRREEDNGSRGAAAHASS
jgi:hypothetical protein